MESDDFWFGKGNEMKTGGLCRSIYMDDGPLDIGGGHFLDVRNQKVNDFLFNYMPEEEWNKFKRNSLIKIKNSLISHPIEGNIWQFDLNTQVEYLKSIAVAGCNIEKEKPTKFIDWIYWKLGERIAGDYMIPYNKKMFGEELNNLGTYWLEKLPNVSFEETLLSCIQKKLMENNQDMRNFFYPKKYGYGELWLRMGECIKKNILYNKEIRKIDLDSHIVTTADNCEYYGDIIITTIPWTEFETIDGLPKNIASNIDELKYSSIQIEYINKNLDTDAHWIYIPDEEVAYHRILVRHNFCPNSAGYWTETNSDRIGKKQERPEEYNFLNKYAYPLNTIDKPDIMTSLLSFCQKKKVFGLGRWGEHQHYNSDVTVEKALKLAEVLENEEE